MSEEGENIMNWVLQITIIFGVLLYLLLIINLLVKRKISLKYSLLWLLSAVVMLFVSVFPGSIETIASLLGFQVSSNLVFSLVVFFMLLILLHVTSIVSKLSDQHYTLIQNLGMLEKRVRELESAEVKEVKRDDLFGE